MIFVVVQGIKACYNNRKLFFIMLKFLFHRKIASIMILVFLIAIFWYSAKAQTFLYGAISQIEIYFQNHAILGIFLFVGLAAVSALASPFSSAPIVPIAVALWGTTFSILFLIAGWLLGHIASYYIGHYASYSIIKNLLPFDKINIYLKKFSSRSEFLLVLLFRLSMPAEIPGYVLGIARYSFWKYFLATFIAEFPFAILTVYGGEAFIKKDIFMLMGIVLFGVAIIFAMFYLFRRKIGENNKTL